MKIGIDCKYGFVPIVIIINYFLLQDAHWLAVVESKALNMDLMDSRMD